MSRTFWPPDDIWRSTMPAEAATEVGADDDRSVDRSVQMMGRLLIYAAVTVAVIGVVVIALTR
jgi:hypothetical protein